MNYHKRRAQKSREALLAAAESAFLENGYSDTSIDVILQASGVSRQTLFSHFGSKENLFLEMCNTMFLRELPELQPSVDYFSGLVDFLFTYSSVVMRDRNVASLRLAITESRKFPELSFNRYKQGSSKMIAMLHEYLKEGMTKGLIRECDSIVLTEQLLMSTLGYRQYRALLGNSDNPASAEQYIKTALLGVVTTKGKNRLKKIPLFADL
ncbi:MAG: TetR/AcrR family transcriptional regulator [Porticoccaceae bacterium]